VPAAHKYCSTAADTGLPVVAVPIQ